MAGAAPAASVGPASAAAPVFAPLASAEPARVDARRMNLLRDVTMGVSVELGRTRMTVRELLALTPGMIVELDKAAGAPVDLLVNGTLMARGEVVVIDEEFAVRISEIVSPTRTTGSGHDPGSRRPGAPNGRAWLTARSSARWCVWSCRWPSSCSCWCSWRAT